jgi:hypothetical protein
LDARYSLISAAFSPADAKTSAVVGFVVVTALIGASRGTGCCLRKPLLPRKASFFHPVTLRNRLELPAFGSSPWSRTLLLMLVVQVGITLAGRSG